MLKLHLQEEKTIRKPKYFQKLLENLESLGLANVNICGYT